MRDVDFARWTVLVVDDEQDNLDAFRFAFRRSFRLAWALGGAQALEMLEETAPAVVVTDQRMPGMSGIELLREVARRRPDTVGVLLTAYTDLPLLLEAINAGGVHRYVQKPWDSKELAVVLRQAIERYVTVRENAELRDRIARYAAYLESAQRDPIDFGALASRAPAMLGAVAELERVAATDAPAIVTGEPGTDKELFARALHVGSAREARPLVFVACVGRDEAALARELFGEGPSRPGRLELGDGGTAVLVDPPPLPPAIEERLVRLVHERTLRRQGAAEPVPVDVRLVVLTSDAPSSIVRTRELAEAMATLVVPPLRERREDLRALCDHALAREATRLARPARRWSEPALDVLVRYAFPGNACELAAIAERAALLAAGEIAGVETLAGPGPDSAAPVTTDRARDLPGQLDAMERRELLAALERFAGNKAEVARALGIQRTTLYYRLRRLGIEP